MANTGEGAARLSLEPAATLEPEITHHPLPRCLASTMTARQVNWSASPCIRPLALALGFFLLVYWGATIAQGSQDDADATNSYEGATLHSGVDSFGQDSIDLLGLGLNIRQELSLPMNVNGLNYQVAANYVGTGTDVKLSIDWSLDPVTGTSKNRSYAYLHPETIWGPLGAGWSVHMGKVLSSGRVEFGDHPQGSGTFLQQCGFDDEMSLNDGAPCDCTSLEYDGRRLFNTIVEPSGIRHPMTSYPHLCDAGEICKWDPTFSSDNSWIRADMESGTRFGGGPKRCHAVLGWRTRDGTHHQVNEEGLVTRITDISGNWIQVEYYDPRAYDPASPGDFPPCTDGDTACRSYVDYTLTRSRLRSAKPAGSEPLIPRDPSWPLRRITDSLGRVTTFELTASPVGGKYRIKRIRSPSPTGAGESVYELNYRTMDVVNFYGPGVVPGPYTENGTDMSPYRSACTSLETSGVGGGICFAPEMRTTAEVDVIEDVAFLSQVVRPDGTTVEFDYFPWGELKSIRTVHGGIAEYRWEWSDVPNSSVSNSGIKVVRRDVRPFEGSPELYRWRFEKNHLMHWHNLCVYYEDCGYLDLDRTILTTPEGNEIAYRFNDYGQVRNVKLYAGSAFRYVKDASNSNANCQEASCIRQHGWPTGRLLREINQWFDQGDLYGAPYYTHTPHRDVLPIVTNVTKPHIGLEGTPASNWQNRFVEFVSAFKVWGVDGNLHEYQTFTVNTRVRQKDVLYFDDFLGPQGCSYETVNEQLTRDWEYDLKGSFIAQGCGATDKDPRTYFPYARVNNLDWMPAQGYRRTVTSGSALGYVREDTRDFASVQYRGDLSPTGISPNEPLVCDPIKSNVKTAYCGSSRCSYHESLLPIISAEKMCENDPNCCCDREANPGGYCPAEDSPVYQHEMKWVKSIVAWERRMQKDGAEVIGGDQTVRLRPTLVTVTDAPLTSQSLTEFEYDRVHLNKLRKQIQRHDPTITPSPYPYDPHPVGTDRDVYSTFGLDPYGRAERITVTGGDPPSIDPGTSGNSQVTYDTTFGFTNGVVSSKQNAGVLWKDVDVTSVTPTGHITELKDPSRVITSFTHDSMGNLVKTKPGGSGSSEPPKRINIWFRSVPASGGLLAGVKLDYVTTEVGPDGVDCAMSPDCSYLQQNFDGLGRIVREARKTGDGQKVERFMTYGVQRTDDPQLRGAMGVASQVSEWVCLRSSPNCTRPAVLPVRTQSVILETQDPLLSGRIDPFLRMWREQEADGATRVMSHFGLNTRVRVEGVQGVDGPFSIENTLYRDQSRNLRLVDATPSVGGNGGGYGADAIYDYDHADRLRKVNLVYQLEPAMSYDSKGFPKSRFAVVNGDQQVRTFSYDSIGRLRSATAPETGVLTYYSYDPVGNPLLFGDAKGKVFWNEYDPVGRPTLLQMCQTPDCSSRVSLSRWDYHNGAEQPRGDSLGKMIGASGFSDTGELLIRQDYFYEGLNGRLSKEETKLSGWSEAGAIGPPLVTLYHYGPDGHMSEIVYPHRADLVGGVDLATRVSYVMQHGALASLGSNRATVAADFKYHPSGLLREILHGNGTKTSIGADERGRLSAIDVYTPGQDPSPVWHTGRYTYDGAGNISGIGEDTDPLISALDRWRFVYDDQLRVIGFSGAGEDRVYSYDFFGNMLPYLYEDNKIQDPNFTYDANGNLLKSPRFGHTELVGYAYDLRNRLLSTGPLDATNTISPIATFAYGAGEARFSKANLLSGWRTFYFRNPAGMVLSEFTRPESGGNPSWARDYIYALDGRNLSVVEASCVTGEVPSNCGNGVCETFAGEDCTWCSQDCRGRQSGKPSTLYCCGDGDGVNPLGCGHPTCNSSGFTCADFPLTFCCGNLVCERGEDATLCGEDCDVRCGDGICHTLENVCICSIDCGPTENMEVSCTDGKDNDCDGTIDMADFNCSCGDGVCASTETPCSCQADCGAVEQPAEVSCADLRDNDCDGFSDGLDADCVNVQKLVPNLDVTRGWMATGYRTTGPNYTEVDEGHPGDDAATVIQAQSSGTLVQVADLYELSNTVNLGKRTSKNIEVLIRWRGLLSSGSDPAQVRVNLIVDGADQGACTTPQATSGAWTSTICTNPGWNNRGWGRTSLDKARLRVQSVLQAQGAAAVELNVSLLEARVHF